MTPAPFVVAVVVNWNGWLDTIACLESLLRASHPSDRLAIVVCDNGSTNGSPDRIREWAAGAFIPELEVPARLRQCVDPPVTKPIAVRWLTEADVDAARPAPMPPGLTVITIESNLGFAGGNNVALRHLFAQTGIDYVWLVNNDVVVDRDAVVALLEESRTRGANAAVGGILFDYFEPERVQEVGGGRFPMWQGLSVPLTNPSVAPESNLAYLTCGFMFVPVALMKHTGTIAEDYFMYGEDVDYSMRLRANGAHFAVATAAKAWHKGGGSTGRRSPRHDYYIVRNHLAVVRRFAPAMLPAAVAYIALRCGLPKVVRREWSRLRVMRRAYGDFFSGTMGPAGPLPGE